MLERIARLFEDTVDDIGFIFKRSTTFVLGKSGGQEIGKQFGLIAGGLIGFIPGLEGTGPIQQVAAGTVAVGAVAGVSAYLVQKDFEHKRESLVERYRSEVGQLLGKAKDKVQEQDLAMVARGDFKKGIPANPSIRRELKNTWLNRNVNFVLATVVSVITFAAVHAIDMFVGDNIGGSLHHIVGEGNALGAMFDAVRNGNFADFREIGGLMLRNGLIGLVTYHGMKTPAHWAAAEILDIDERTVNDRITEIKRTLGHGRDVQPEQVLGTFIHAHHDIEEQIEAEYGKKFDKMSHKQQGELLSVVQEYMNVKEITDNINHGRMRPEELVFAAYGQSSGTEMADAGTHHQRGNILDGMWKGLQAVTGGYKTTAHSKQQMEDVSDEIASQMPGTTRVNVHTPDENHASMHVQNEYEEPGKKRSFAARVARSRDVSPDGLSHVERLEQSSSQETVLTPNATQLV